MERPSRRYNLAETYAQESPLRVRSMFSWPRPRSAASTPTTAILRNSFATTWQFRPTLSIAWKHGAKKLLFLGSSCIYPKLPPQPLRDDALLTGPLEPTNDAYAIAKIAGLKMCQAYRQQYRFDAIVAMPTTLYGPGDNYHPENSHVVPALIRRIHEAKLAKAYEVVIWGSGKPLREFLHVDDLADAALFLMQHHSDEAMVNVGSGQEVSIAELARTIADVVGYRGNLAFDTSKPDGTPRKLMDVSRLNAMGWRARTPLLDGIRSTYAQFVNSNAEATPAAS